MGDIDKGQGHAPSGSTQDLDFSALDAPESILELAAACARFVQGKYGIALDFSGDTLSLVDQYVRDARAEVAVKPETFDLVAMAVGGYLGEVLRRSFGGEWFVEGEPHQYRLYFTRVKLSVNPVALAREALLEAPDEVYPSAFVVDPEYRAYVTQRVESMPDVPEDEYYLPSTRFDMAAALVDTLRGKLAEAGRENLRFTRDDY